MVAIATGLAILKDGSMKKQFEDGSMNDRMKFQPTSHGNLMVLGGSSHLVSGY